MALLYLHRSLPALSISGGAAASVPWTFISVVPSSADVACLSFALPSFYDLEHVH